MTTEQVITLDPDIHGGLPVFTGTRVPVKLRMFRNAFHIKVAQGFVLSNRDRNYEAFLETPEFSDVKDDEAFLEVLGQK
ncbi:MAG: DUF433 domain-containing protein [Candidatus Poribacteria bacterium]|nr:DUF433 domain-containing protein [Candidatus Poribacteria bacterium]